VGASGRNGGQFIFGFASSQEKLVSEVGFDVARRMFDLSIEALDLLEDRITRHSIVCDREHGHIHAAVRPRHVDELKAWQVELGERYDYRSLRWLGRDEMRGLFATDRYPGGLLDMRSGHLHPLNYTLGLAAAAKAAGVLLFEDSPAVKVEPGDRRSSKRPTAACARATSCCAATRTSTSSCRSCVRASCRSAPTSSPPNRSARSADKR
jgi:gamma-glutamylputrescine oxidase